MTPTELREVLAALGLSQSRAARLLGVHIRTATRWCSGEQDIPPPVQRFLRLMLALKLTPAKVHKLLDGN